MGAEHSNTLEVLEAIPVEPNRRGAEPLTQEVLKFIEVEPNRRGAEPLTQEVLKFIEVEPNRRGAEPLTQEVLKFIEVEPNRRGAEPLTQEVLKFIEVEPNWRGTEPLTQEVLEAIPVKSVSMPKLLKRKPREVKIHEFMVPEIDSTNELLGSTSNVSANSSSAISQRGKRLGKYPLSKKAYVLVFHHYSFDDSTHDRAGSERDIEKIRLFFQDYHVDRLTEATNKTAREVRYIMDMISCKDFSDYSCLITIIMSHGLENDRIEARDGETYCFEGDIVDKCTSNLTLDGKPKIFIVQACRGDSLIVADSRKTQSKKDDVLIFQSTYKGFVALRDIQNGTFFVQSFFDLLDEHRDEDIGLVNKHLNHVFKQKGISQNPTMSTTLTKDFVFADLRIS